MTEIDWNFSKEAICEQDKFMSNYIGLLQEHKEKAQAVLEYYRNLISDATATCAQISMLQQQNIDEQRITHLRAVKKRFCGFASADYMMGKIYLTGVNMHNPPRPII